MVKARARSAYNSLIESAKRESWILAHFLHHLLKKERFWGVFWVDVSTTSSAESAFLHIATKLQNPAQTFREAVQGLANTQHPWLLVLDNADDPSVDYQQYLPTGPWGVVVLTSRNQACDVYATAEGISLDGLSDAEACELLMRAAKIPQDQHQTLEDDARKVAALLRSHALALIQAGSYIARGHSTMADYPRVFAQKRRRLLEFHPTQAQSRYRDVYATFEASAEILQSTGTEAATDALQLLPVLATFDSNRLPLPLFEAGWKGARPYMAKLNSARDYNDNAGDTDDTLNMTAWHDSRLLLLMQVGDRQWDPHRLIEAVDLLESFSLVSKDNHSGFLSVSMHPLVHAWARDRQDSTEQNTSWITSGCIIAMSREDGDFWLQHSRQLRPHLHALVAFETSKLFVCCPAKKVTVILLQCGWLLYDMKDSALVDSLMQGLFSELGLNMHTMKGEWLNIYDLTARNLRQYGKPSRAVLLLDQIVRFREERLPAYDNDLLTSQHELASAYVTNGRIQEAMALLEKVVKIQEETLGEDHPRRLTSQHELARAYGINGRIQEAMILLEKVVRIQEETLIEDHPDRLASQHELARAYGINGRIQEAIVLLEKVVKIQEETLREDHPRRLASQHELARAYGINGRIQEAITLLEKVVKIKEETLREDHPDRLMSQYNLAICYWKIGRRDTAFEMMVHVVKIRQQVLPEDNPQRIRSEEWLEYFRKSCMTLRLDRP